MRLLVPGVALAAMGLVLLAALRGNRELVRWRGLDDWALRRALRALALAITLGLLLLAVFRAADLPPDLSSAKRDVVLLVDVSRSMGVSDVAPSRLRRAVRMATELALEADASRVGLVLFAGDGFAALPLTRDRDAVLTYLAALDTDIVSHRGSDIARGIEVALRVFDPRSRHSRRIVLLSDGEHAGRSLSAATARARSEGVHVTSVGFGEVRGGAVPGPGGRSLRDSDANEIVSRRNDPLLEQIAADTDGVFYVEHRDRPGAAALLPAPAEKTGPADRSRQPLAARGWAGLAFALLLLEIVLSTATRFPLLPAPALACVALCLLGVAGAGWLREGDAALAEGDAQKALSLYRRTERTHGATADTRLRIGNGLFKEGKSNRAIAAYLDALRTLPRAAVEQRFVANFNLGDALLVSERYGEARDAFWTAILEHPDSIEAKFNYEYALERAPPEEPSADPAEAAEKADGSELIDGDGGTPLDPLVPARAAQRREQSLAKGEAERWMASLDERVDAPLKRQIAQEMHPNPQPAPGGQTW